MHFSPFWRERETMRNCWTLFLLAKGSQNFLNNKTWSGGSSSFSIVCCFASQLPALCCAVAIRLIRTSFSSRRLRGRRDGASHVFVLVMFAGRALQMEDDLVISFQLLLCTLELFIKRCSADQLQPLYRKIHQHLSQTLSLFHTFWSPYNYLIISYYLNINI